MIAENSFGVQSRNCTSSLTMKSNLLAQAACFLVLVGSCCWISGADAGFAYVGSVGSKVFIKDDDFNGTLYETKAHCVNAGYDLVRIETEEEMNFLMANHAEQLRKNYWLDAKAEHRTTGRGCFWWFDYNEIPAFLQPYHYTERWGIGLQYIPTTFGSDLPQVPYTRQGSALCTIKLIT